MRYPLPLRSLTTLAGCAALLLALGLPSPSGAGEDDAEGAEPTAPQAPRPPPLWKANQSAVPFQEVPEGLPSLSAQSCNACHGPVHARWIDSGHGRAWSSPLYQEALQRAEEPAYCLRCHIPLLNQRRSVVKGYDEGVLSRPRTEPNPRNDSTLRTEGVTCAACHVRDGVVYGPRTLVPGEAPHAVTAHPELGEPAFCASCHQLAWPGTEDKPLYDTYREWEASAWGQAGVRCQDCHMPLVVGRTSGSRFAAHPDHHVVGASDDATLARALTVLVGPTPAVLQRGTELAVAVRVLNTGAGHHVPSGNPHSWIELRARCEGVDGLEPAEQSWALRREVQLDGEHDEIQDTRLASGAEVTFDYAVTPDKKLPAPTTLVLVVELVYHRLPAELLEQYGKQEADVSRVFHRQEIAIPLR